MVILVRLEDQVPRYAPRCWARKSKERGCVLADGRLELMMKKNQKRCR